MRYRFIGGRAEIGVTKLSQFGQAVDLDHKTAFQLLAAPVPVPILPDSAFREIGFTEQELAEFRTPLSHGPEGTPAIRRRFHKDGVSEKNQSAMREYLLGFERKKARAIEVFHKIRKEAVESRAQKKPFDLSQAAKPKPPVSAGHMKE